MLKAHVKHNYSEERFFKKQNFLLLRLGSINYSLILCLEWKGGRYYPSADGGTYKGGGGFVLALLGSQGFVSMLIRPS